MNIDHAVKEACKEPSLLEALTWIAGWEGSRIVKQARENYGSGANGAGWDTCFRVCLERVLKEYVPNTTMPASVFPLNSVVLIKELERRGRVLAIYQSDTGTQYQIRYFWEGEAKIVYFYLDELESVRSK